MHYSIPHQPIGKLMTMVNSIQNSQSRSTMYLCLVAIDRVYLGILEQENYRVVVMPGYWAVGGSGLLQASP